MSSEELEKNIGIVFKNKDLLTESLTHRSYLNEYPKWRLPHNERLEYLGDAVLVEGLGDQDHLAGPFRLAGGVERPDAFDAQAHQPVVILAEGGQQLLGIAQRRQFIRRAAAREEQKKP